jgi:eukaryotic-like serine/threonine-protein kinase
MANPNQNSETILIELADDNSSFENSASLERESPLDEGFPELDTAQFRIIRLLKQGGMGFVYLAHDEKLKRDVAIKVLRRDRVHLPQAVPNFVREAYVMAELTHPGVAPVYAIGTCRDGRPYHAMKLVDGVTFAEVLKDPRRSTAERLKIFSDVCQTMAFAHARKIIHLDLKPSNIMVGPFGEVIVMDWGLAQRCSSLQVQGNQCLATGEKSQQHIINGTPSYMSPEQARGSPLDERADVFSLGGMLCEILCGRAPYEGQTLRQVYRYAASGRTEETLERLKKCGIDDALVRLAINCLSSEPANRPGDAIVLSRIIRAHQEATLLEVQSDMNRFFELSLDLFCIADLDGYFVRINDNFSKVLGHTNADLLSQPFLNFVHEADRLDTIEKMSVLNEGKPVVRFRNRYRTLTGDYVTLEWTAKSISDERLVFAVARDVTDYPLSDPATP